MAEEGLGPSTLALWVLRSNQLSYPAIIIHTYLFSFTFWLKQGDVRPAGFEPATSWSEAKRSIQLSYKRNNTSFFKEVFFF